MLFSCGPPSILLHIEGMRWCCCKPPINPSSIIVAGERAEHSSSFGQREIPQRSHLPSPFITTVFCTVVSWLASVPSLR